MMIGLLMVITLLQTEVGIAQERVEDTLKPSFWDRWSVGVSYSGGICGTGEDLKSYICSDIGLTFPFYWLNLSEGGVYYTVKENWKIGIKTGYGWARLDNGLSKDWKFSLIPTSIEIEFPKDFLDILFPLNARIGYVCGSSYAIKEIWQEGEIVDYKTEKGRGNGLICSFGFILNDFISIETIFGSARFTGKSVDYPVTLPFYGIVGSIRIFFK